MTTAAAPSSTDLVVVLPGIMGSTLGQTTATKRAKDNLVWAVTGRAALHGARNFLGHAPRSRSGPSTSSNFDVFAHSLPSLYQLFPEYACITSRPGRPRAASACRRPRSEASGRCCRYGALSRQTVSPFENHRGVGAGWP
jgi:hypothetical protein